MINKLDIRNFKSIKDLQLDCKRVNLFIGEPNVGKSNILEALALFALPISAKVSDLVRYNDLSNIFFDNDPAAKVSISAVGMCSLEINYDVSVGNIAILFLPDNVLQTYKNDGEGSPGLQIKPIDLSIHPYFFRSNKDFKNRNFGFLATPYGDNLFTLLQTNKSLRTLVSDFVQERGFKLTLRQATSEIEISKEVDNVLTTYPYQVVSDTLQRILFYIAAVETNNAGTSLIFEEPESNVFPYYTKYLAEKIAYSDDKQYFITTHNPYFLQSLLQKTPLEDLQVNLVYMKDFQTKVRPITVKEEIEELIDLESNVFLNLDKFLSE